MNSLAARRRTIAIALVAMVAMLSGGCGGYRPKPPIRAIGVTADTPTAKVWNTEGDGCVTYLVSVDGKRVPYKGVLFSHDTTPPVLIPAGVRRLEVTIETGNYLTGWVFDFPFTAGHEYTLQRATGKDDRVVVFNITTKRPVVIQKPKRL